MLRWLTGVLAATALLAAGCGGTTGHVGAGADTIVPASAPAYIALDTNLESSQWQAIRALVDKFPAAPKGTASLERDLRRQAGLDWKTDVKPALGDELDLVWLDLGNKGQDVVALTQPKDEGKFKALVAKGKAVSDSFRGWQVVARSQDAIDRFEQASNSAASSLADDGTFKQALDRLGSDSVLRVYVNGKAVTDAARTYGGGALRPYLSKVGKLDWIGARLGATSDGIGLDTIVHGSLKQLFKSGFTPHLLGSVPQDALLYLTFHGSKNMLDGVLQNPLLKTPQLRQFSGPLAQVGRLLAGENALYVRPANGMPEITLVATPPKGVDGAAVVSRLSKRFGGLYSANVHGRLVVSDKPAALHALKGPTLSSSEHFQDAKTAAGLPNTTQGFLYVDIKSSIPFVEKLAHQRISADLARNLAPLRSAVTYAASHSHELQVTFFLRIK